MDAKKALIVGINGFVGTYLKNELEAHGYEVYGCDCNIKGSVIQERLYETDITNGNDVCNLISAVCPDYIFNLAAISSVGLSWKIPQDTVNVNVGGTINILEAVRKAGLATKILLIGSSEEYASSNRPVSETDKLDAVNPYGISRIAIEKFANLYRNRYGLDITCIRAFNHTGIGQTNVFVLPSFVRQVAKIAASNIHGGGSIKVGNVSVYRDFSDVRDIVCAYRLIAECEDKIDVINVGSGTAYKLEDLLNYIISLSGKEIEVIIDKEKFRPADLPYCCCNNSLLRCKTKWRPENNVYDTLKIMYEDCLKNLNRLD